MKIAILTFGLLLGAAPCYAMSDTVSAPDGGLFGMPTSIEAILVSVDEPMNIDRSKNAAKIPPAFGSNTMNLPDSGTYLTPNLVDRENTVQTVNNLGTGVTLIPPSTQSNTEISKNSGSDTEYRVYQAFTPVTNDLYYSAGHIGTLRIPELNLSVKVYEGTDSSTLKKGVGHFSFTSIRDGNVALAAHNRGVNNHFGEIHTLSDGDKITLTTKLGTKTYHVFSIRKIHKDDVSVLNDTSVDIITLITCVRDQADYRWCVQGIAAD